jgi:hypothetical protein
MRMMYVDGLQLGVESHWYPLRHHRGSHLRLSDLVTGSLVYEAR